MGRPLISEFIEQTIYSNEFRSAMEARDHKSASEIMKPKLILLLESIQDIRDSVITNGRQSSFNRVETEN